MVKEILHQFQTEEVMYRTADCLVTGILVSAIRKQGTASLVLAGGKTPHGLYQRLAKHDTPEIPWPAVQIFFGDERAVLPSNPESNYRMAYELLISRILIPDRNVHRIQGELKPEKAAERYEEEIFRTFGLQEKTQIPSFDIVILGMGEDGHTASLFPGYPTLTSERLVDWVPLSPTVPLLPRVTLTLKIINKAKTIIVLAHGEKKRKTIEKVIARREASTLPVAFLKPQKELLWFLG